jgi:sulfur-oxidizing protein SoxY
LNGNDPQANPQHFHLRRREVLKGAALGGATLLLALGMADAADASKDMVLAKASIYPKQAFAQTTEAKALKALYGKTPMKSSNVKLGAPDIAENGAVVPISVDANLPKVTSISILALDNPFTLTASYKIPPGTDPAISSRIKLAKTTKVIAVVESDGKLYSASKQVKVTLGGCG